MRDYIFFSKREKKEIEYSYLMELASCSTEMSLSCSSFLTPSEFLR